VEAIREACRTLGDFRLAGAELCASCEPCPLCLAASYWARIARVYYSATGAQAAAAGFDDESIRLDLLRPPPERQLPLTRFLGDEGGPVFDLWRAKADRVPY
jgi:guanine deaminase